MRFTGSHPDRSPQTSDEFSLDAKNRDGEGHRLEAQQESGRCPQRSLAVKEASATSHGDLALKWRHIFDLARDQGGVQA